MKKIKLFALSTIVGLATIAPLTTITSCNNGGGESEDQKVVTLKNVNLSHESLSIYKAGKISASNSTKNESEDATPTLWETKLEEGNLVMSEVTGKDVDDKTVTIAPDWAKQIDKNHLILSFSNNYHDEGNVQYCINLENGKCTKLTDFWVVETIDDHDFAFQTRTIGDKQYIFFVANYANFQGRQNSQGGGLIRVEADYFDTFDSSKITKVSSDNQWIGTMVWDKGRPVAHHFSVNTKGDVLYYCSTLEQPSQEGYDNKWGLLYNKVHEDGTYNPDEAYKLFYHITGGTSKMHCSVSAIFNNGEDFYYKDEGNGIVFHPTFEILPENHEYFVNLSLEQYLNPTEAYGIISPYSRHIVRTTIASNGSEKIVNIDNGYILDLYPNNSNNKGENDPSGPHHYNFLSKYDYVDYTNNIVYFVNEAKKIGSTDYAKPTIFAMPLVKGETEYYHYDISKQAEISGDFDVNNLQFTSFNVIDDNNVLIGAYDNVKSAYVTIQGKYIGTDGIKWEFTLSKKQYTTSIDQFEVIQNQ